jgi:DNA-binding PadR family transcriptional regulator
VSSTETDDATRHGATEAGSTATGTSSRLKGPRSELGGAEDEADLAETMRLARERDATDVGFRFDADYVKHDLEEIVLSIITLDGMTHGKGVMEALAGSFDNELSSGTVYPSLHDLEAAGLPERHDLVRTKQYGIADEDAAMARLEAAMEQPRTMAAFLETVLADAGS